MTLLLDSHVFVWWVAEKYKLSQAALTHLSDSTNDFFLSVASVWELQIKIQLGKFEFKDTLENIVAEQCRINGLKILPVELSHALAIGNLPKHHKDPFDRLLIAQAIVEKMTLVSSDKQFSSYEVNVLW